MRDASADGFQIVACMAERYLKHVYLPEDSLSVFVPCFGFVTVSSMSDKYQKSAYFKSFFAPCAKQNPNVPLHETPRSVIYIYICIYIYIDI